MFISPPQGRMSRLNPGSRGPLCTHTIPGAVHGHCTFYSLLSSFAVDLIGPEKAGFLCELLDEVGRKDLTAIVREYMDKLDSKLQCYYAYV